jgi:ABC-type Zn uptake system ZnuABC Zn-binding protein ZnuA
MNLGLRLIIGLGLSVSSLQAKPLTVASFSTITTDIAKNVGGSWVQVDAIVGPGVDPHEFQPVPADIEKVSQDDLVLLTGKGIEGYLIKLEQTVGNPGKFIETGKAFPSLKLSDEGKTVEDPHWWHSIANVEKAAQVVRDAFVKADPSHAKDYNRNTEAYLRSLEALQEWALEKMATLPRDKRKLVTSHDAFQYFARDYGFIIYPIEGVSTSDEPSSRKVSELIETIKSQGVKAVFFENIENPKVVREITKETGARIGGELYADGLGDKAATTYIEMMKWNINTIVDSLK